MPSIPGLVGPVAITQGIRQSLALARGANPTSSSLGGSFDRHLDLARQADAVATAPATGPDGSISVEAIRAEYQTALADFEMRFRRLLRERGIDFGEGIVLEANRQGDVQMVGDHPQQQAIEALFQEHPELRNLFVQLDSQASLLRAADLAAELSRLQSESPGDAAAQVQQLLGATRPKFSLIISPEELAARFS